ncbi:hypothetical protein J437_LFUL019340, partial [Ladona fulva]
MGTILLNNSLGVNQLDLAINYGHSLEKMDFVIIFHCTAVKSLRRLKMHRYEHKFFALLDELREKGIRATGTIRENRMAKCTLMSAEELEKFPKGYNDYRFESNNEIFIGRWKDNKCVAVATNFDTLEPTVQVMRWCKEKSAKAYVPQPALINNYNKYMGGEDMHDWLLEKHAIAIKGKKRYWRVFTRIVDMSIVNAYLLYRDIHGKQSISIKDFRRAITVHYLKLGY